MDTLFQSRVLADYLAEKAERMHRDIADFDPDELLAASETEIATYFADTCLVDPIVLQRDATWADEPQEVELTVRGVFGDQRAPGARVRFHVPFTGDRNVLFLQPATFSLGSNPAASVSDADLIFVYTDRAVSADAMRTRLDRDLGDIEERLTWGRDQLSAHNEGLFDAALKQIRDRKARILADRDQVSRIGVPVRRRNDEPRVAVPLERRRPRVDRPQPSAAVARPYTPEPVLNDADFDHALQTLVSGCRQFERSPTTTLKLDEEERRDMLLVSLNAQFEGKAGGEVFNGAGRSDILLRCEDRNVFIAECKIWDGPKTVSDAVDQLLGYLVWRDTKAVLVVFIHTVNATETIEKARVAIRDHPRVVRETPARADGQFQFVVIADDERREIHLSFLPVVVQARS
jgi:hypothetical protein